MGLPGFEPGSQAPKARRMDQATLQPPGIKIKNKNIETFANYFTNSFALSLEYFQSAGSFPCTL